MRAAADVAEEGANAALVSLAVESFGGLDAAVLNAGFPGLAVLMVLAFTVLHGLAWGTRGPLMVALRADYFGPSSFGTIMGFSSLIVMLGMSGGPGILTFNARQLGAATNIYMEPDFIMLTAPGERVRHTVLYRHGEAMRTLTARGTRLWPTCERRHSLDPRGPEGPVHETPFVSPIWSHLVDGEDA